MLTTVTMVTVKPVIVELVQEWNQIQENQEIIKLRKPYNDEDYPYQAVSMQSLIDS